MKAPINSVKHYVQNSIFNVASGAKAQLTIADAVAVVTAGVTSHVLEGSIVKAVYLEYWIGSGDATESSFVVSLEKEVAGATSMTFAQSITLFVYPNKKNLFYVIQGLLGQQVQQGIPVVRQWFKIPKGKQRMGLGDRIVVNFSAITNDMNVCGVSVYKSYV